ncbi:uncharacterized protein Z518_10080 [Rhinocladiella mackenziei CBS 650.93]|uniref:Uncharacterized protein n=1 Tax=Rhinocladiella mackenziei CBS 650.93 TaxID=1442369 RepID=A0A0D2I5H4_9EURO|nr:uncharacterized protein Z518_10080 [Rhinocladiella mackenziei CBS 650.93]KIX01014.1 hypothetical protein Z518_10080 [Rhinocladiella mackenziei CBS 650.93]
MFEPTEQHTLEGSANLSDDPIYTNSRPWSASTRRLFRKNLLEVVDENENYSRDVTNLERPKTGASSITLVALKNTLILLAFSFPIVAFALVLRIPQWYSFHADYRVKTFTHCNFNGKFTPDATPSISMWDKSGFFYITVAWGKMAFSTAKFIDIVWDIAMGRAGQAFLAWVTYRVSSQYLAMAMYEASVSYTTFESLAFVPPTLTRTGRLAGELLTNRGWRPRLIMVWIILSSLFVLSFSSLVTAMSGYSSNMWAVMNNYEGEAVDWSDYEVVQFAINDAWRIEEPGPVSITMGNTCLQQGFTSDDDDDDSNSYYRRDDSDEDEDDHDDEDDDPFEYVPFNCTLFWRTVQYVNLYGLNSARKIPSTFTLNGKTHNLTSPTLNITTSYTAASLKTLSTYLENFSIELSSSLNSVNDLSDSTFWIYDNETYSWDYVLDHATCRYSKWHNWGFSFLLLFITTLLLAVWTVGTYALWLYVYLHGPRSDSSQHASGMGSGTIGIYRSSWDLVEAMRRDLGPHAITSDMGERDIRNLVRRRRVGGLQDIRYGPGTTQSHTTFETEKHSHHLPTTTPSCSQSPIQLHPTRWEEFRSWLSPSSFHHTSSTFSSTSQHPILMPPGTPGTMTSRMSSTAPSPSLASPSSTIFGFANQPLATSPTDMISDTGTGMVLPNPVNVGSRRKSSRRPKFGRLRRMSLSGHGQQRANKTASASASAAQFPSMPSIAASWWLPSAVATSSSSSSSSTAARSIADADSPIRADSWPERRGPSKPTTENAVVFRNDLGDDQA